MSQNYTINKPIPLIATIIYVAVNMLPSIKMPHIELIVFAIMIVVLLLSDISFHQKLLTQKYYPLFFFLLFYFITTTLGRDVKSSFNLTAVQCNCFMPIILYDYFKNTSKSTRILVCASFSIIYLISIVDLYYFSLANMEIYSTMGEDYDFRNQFELSYSVLFLPVFGFLLLNRWNSININGFSKSLISISMISLVIVVFVNSYATALVIMIMGIIVSFLYAKKHWKIKFLLVMMILGLLFLSYYSIVESFLRDLNADRLLYRANEILNTLQGNHNYNIDTLERGNRFLSSLEVFFHHPILGVNHMCSSYNDYFILGVGLHSEWMDDMALYGIIAISLFVFLSRSYKDINDREVLIPIFVTFILLGFFNPFISFPTIATVFFFIPLLNELLNSTEANI